MQDEESIGEFSSDGNFNIEDQEDDSEDLEELKLKVAEEENKLIFWSRLVVLCVLLVSAGLVAFFTYYFLSEEEVDDFETQFNFDSREILQVSNKNANSIMGLVQVFGKLIAATAMSTGATWPNFTLPDFEVFGKDSRDLSGALLIAFSPLVEDNDRETWERYSTENQGWVKEGLSYIGSSIKPANITEYIYKRSIRTFVPENAEGPFSPVWQLSPPPTDTSIINFNLFNHPTFKRLVLFAIETRQAAISEVLDTSLVFGSSAPQKGDDPQSILVQPVFRDPADDTSDIVGHVIAVIPWGLFFQDVLQESSKGIYCVLRESCGQEFTYRVDGPVATFLGDEDMHEPAYNNLKQSARFASYEGDLTGLSDLSDHCEYQLDVYPSKMSEEESQTNRPLIFSIGVALVFIFASAVFFLYDWLVARRQNKVMNNALKSNAIVASLFPSQVRADLERVHEERLKKKEAAKNMKKGNRLGQFTTDDKAAMEIGDDEIVDDKPIADLFPECTVLFADIAGFTSWSSVREPSQVFILLETIYKAFDKIASQRGVYKVETIGDCYLAVCGLPEPRKDHAIVMARFARDMMEKMNELTRKLESKLGLGTSDLAMRIGLHSGPVTGGILRGDRARFQLFGDTVNTASRMESNGLRERIQISEQCANLLIQAGKAAWVTPREDKISAKGKGELQTYWLSKSSRSSKAESDTNRGSDEGDNPTHMDSFHESSASIAYSPRDSTSKAIQETLSPNHERLIDWNTEMLMQYLRLVVAKRKLVQAKSKKSLSNKMALDQIEQSIGAEGMVIDEVRETISLPPFEAATEILTDKVEDLSEEVKTQTRMFVAAISSMYRTNSFHNFEHASHVTMSTVKLLTRIVSPTKVVKSSLGQVKTETLAGEDLHVNSYGISSDPLTQFSVIFSALIHDVDHRGVPNFILSQEDPSLASVYKGKSVAEQNSVDIAWNLLQDDSYSELRKTIYSDVDELKRFRQVVVNSVMATDIFDKELGELRKNRWAKAFSEDHLMKHASQLDKAALDRKATIVLEHLIQASDVSHTMQHWHVYQKWNERLFKEMNEAFVAGRSAKSPSDGWYEGEIGFYENYIIPLAKKLKDCTVFGVSSDEYLNYAEENLNQWKIQGKDIVRQYAQQAGSSQ